MEWCLFYLEELINMDNKRFDKINEVEGFLYNYKSIKLAIENLKMELESIKKTNNCIEEELLKSRIEHMETKVKQIDKALEILPDVEKEIIQYRYIEGKNYYEFTYKIYKSERQARRLKNKALQKIVIVFFGIE